MSLLDKFGRDDFMMYYANGLFLHEGIVHQVVTALADGEVRCLVVGDRMINVPGYKFTSMDMFAYPRLGWRQMLDGKIAAYLTRQHSYKKAITPEHTQMFFEPVTNNMFSNMIIQGDLGSVSSIGKAVFFPTYYGLQEAISRLVDGESISVALNADFCIAPDPMDQNKLAIYCKQDKVGECDLRGRNVAIAAALRGSWTKVVGANE